MRKGRKGLLMLAGSILAALLMAAWPVSEPIEVETVIIQKGELVQTLLLNGTVCYSDEQPFITPKSGRIAQVFVKQGQQIRKGDLLFKLDTQMEERTLEALYEKRFAHNMALAGMDEAVSVLALQNELEWRNLETQMLANIEASQIRAAADGVVDAVYVHAGENVAECMLLGTAHGDGVQIVAAVCAEDGLRLQTGSAAITEVGDQRVPVRLVRKQTADTGGAQTVIFETLEEKDHEWLEAGENVRLEAARKLEASSALIPLAAIDETGKIWVVQEGKACSKTFTPGKCSRTHAAAGEEWVGLTVILYPDTCVLSEGMTVRVKK